jgi:hypothetical protein
VERLSILWLCCVLAPSSGCLLLVDPPDFTDDSGDPGYTGSAAPSSGWTDVAVSFNRPCALDAEGQLWCGDVGDLSLRDTGPFVSLSASGWGDACGVQLDGLLLCGIDSSTSGFELTGDFVEVVGSSDAGCGLLADGSARCWPEATNVPGPYESLGAGDTFACGITASGTLECWGIDNLVFDEALNDIPSGTFTQVVTGDHVGCALSAAGSITCWGYDYSGGLLWPPSGETYRDLSLQYGAGCAVAESGSVTCWGEDAGDPNHGQLFPPAGIAFSTVRVGESTSCGITVDSTLQCWGD